MHLLGRARKAGRSEGSRGQQDVDVGKEKDKSKKRWEAKLG